MRVVRRGGWKAGGRRVGERVEVGRGGDEVSQSIGNRAEGVTAKRRRRRWWAGASVGKESVDKWQLEQC